MQSTERRRVERRNEVEAYRLELRHFEQHLQRDEISELAGLPLLRRSSDRVLDYLTESDLERGGARPGLLRRIRKYFKYGSLRGLDPEDTNVVLRLQRAYYDKRIAELDEEIERLESELWRADFDQLAWEHQQLSTRVLHAELGSRYQARSRTTYQQDTYKRGKTFADFITDYPVLLSTCHSLGSSTANGFLLDYLIIEEASQVDPLVAGLALARCRNLVVVGDTQQLSLIAPASAVEHLPPSPAYDCRNSILSSLREMHGDEALPRTLLRERYRCDPAIIGFCNKKFYEGKLIPYTSSGDTRSVIVVRTVEGDHMRQHRQGGRSNQREVDVIEAEVIPVVRSPPARARPRRPMRSGPRQARLGGAATPWATPAFAERTRRATSAREPSNWVAGVWRRWPMPTGSGGPLNRAPRKRSTTPRCGERAAASTTRERAKPPRPSPTSAHRKASSLAARSMLSSTTSRTTPRTAARTTTTAPIACPEQFLLLKSISRRDVPSGALFGRSGAQQNTFRLVHC